MGVALSSSHVVSVASSSSGEDSSHSAPAPAWLPTTGYSPSETDCCSVGLLRGHKPCQQTSSSVGSSLLGSTGPASSLLQHGLPTASQSPSGIHLLWCGILLGCRWISVPLQISMSCRAKACLAMVFSMGCRGISAPMPGAPPPPPPSSLTLVCAELFLSCILTPLSHFSCAGFSPLLKCVITEALPPSQTVLALASSRSVLEPAGTASVRHRGSFWQLLGEATPVAASATQTLPCKPNTKDTRMKTANELWSEKRGETRSLVI